MKLTIYIDENEIDGKDSIIYSMDLPTDEEAQVVVQDKELELLDRKKVVLGVSKAVGKRYSVWIFDDKKPVLITSSMVDGFSNTRAYLPDGYFMNIHIEEESSR